MTTILRWASLVPLLTLKHFRLDSTAYEIPASGPLLPQTSMNNWPLHQISNLSGLIEMTTKEESSHSSGPFPISSCLFLERFQYWQEWGLPLPKVFVGSFRSHTETLPRRTPTAMKPRLCSTFSGEFFRRPTHINWPTYSLGTVVGQTTTVHFQTLPVKRRSFSQPEKTSYIRHTSLRYSIASCCCRLIHPASIINSIV